MVTFAKDSGVDLVDAVAASCAVPGVWPPVTIDGSRYIDGGVRSGTNADMAARVRSSPRRHPVASGLASTVGKH
jgi:NTE family protein